MLTEFLPPIDEALQPLPDVFFSKNGLQYPDSVVGDGPRLAGGGRARRLRGGVGLGTKSRGVASRRPGGRCR